MAITSGETLSLNNLAGARGHTQGSNVSLGSVYSGIAQAGDNISIGSFGIDTISSGITGYTYAVEGTNETYTMGFTGAGSQFASISSRYQNFTWSVSPTHNGAPNASGYLNINANQDLSAVVSITYMNAAFADADQGNGTQGTLMGNVSHTLSATFADGFNDHATNYNIAQTKTVYSVDSYDGNSTALCLTIDSPVTLADGTTIEVGDLEEGDVLRGFSIGGLGTDETGFLDWSAETLTTDAQDVVVENLVYSFSGRHYDINDGEITATAEHPMLVKDATDGEYRFKEMFNITTNDKLIKEVSGVITEIDVISIDIVNQTSEIVSIDVETNDTYLVNGYITHNKGGNSHTDETAGSAPTTLAWANGTHTLSWSGDGTNDVYDVQIDDNSNFSSTLVSQTQWSATSVVTTTDSGTFDIGTGTRYARVRQYSTNGLLSNYSSVLTFTVS